MGHRSSRLCPMPMTLVGIDQDNVAGHNLELLIGGRDDAAAGRYDQHLFSRVGVPPIPGAILECNGGHSQRFRILIRHQALPERFADEKRAVVPDGR